MIFTNCTAAHATHYISVYILNTRMINRHGTTHHHKQPAQLSS